LKRKREREEEEKERKREEKGSTGIWGVFLLLPSQAMVEHD
jgi:hypothetical protein